MRCLKFGVDCDGYDNNYKGSNPSRQAPVRELIARTNNGVPLLAPSRMELPFATFFQDGTEYMYFLNYQEEASLELSGPFDASLWNRVVLQACQNEPCLCRLTAAIGALSRASRLRILGSYQDEAFSHEKYALREYGRALKSIQGMISDPNRRDTARIALIASLLIFCFENLLGDFDLAIMHMESALHLMNKQLLQAAGRRYNHFKNASPTPSLEDDLVTAFVRMDSALLSRTDNSSTRRMGSDIVRTPILDINYSADVYNVPHRFRTINEARSYLEHIQFRALPSLAHEFGVQISDNPDTINTFALDLCKSHSQQFDQWRAAFAPLYAEACKSRKGKDFVAAATLRVSGLATEITAQRMVIRGRDASGLYEYEACEIINLSRLVIGDPSFRKGFVFDCGIVPGLFIVVVICENLEIRKEALQVLKSTVPRREGVWDSVTLVNVAEQVLQMVEAGGLKGIV
jgi:hypothetical protein